jgi:DNA topoisomerase-1
VRDEATWSASVSLAVPPAYKDVGSARTPTAYPGDRPRRQGRKQYRYHPRWREVRDAAKFDHMMEFAAALPASGRAWTPT